MPLTIQAKLTKIGNSLRITVPIDVVRALSWREGDLLEIGLTEGEMTAKKAVEK